MNTIKLSLLIVFTTVPAHGMLTIASKITPRTRLITFAVRQLTDEVDTDSLEELKKRVNAELCKPHELDQWLASELQKPNKEAKGLSKLSRHEILDAYIKLRKVDLLDDQKYIDDCFSDESVSNNQRQNYLQDFLIVKKQSNDDWLEKTKTQFKALDESIFTEDCSDDKTKKHCN